MNDIQTEDMNFNVKPRYQTGGFSHGKNTVTRKTTVNFDMDEWEKLNGVSEEYGIPVSKVLRNTVRQQFNLQYS